jgi:SPP1 family predicted phage head-tail adaptor
MANPTAAGLMRDRIEVQVQRETTAPDGGISENWVTERAVWAWVRELRGAERVEATAVEGQVTHRINMNYYPGLTSEYRIRFRGDILNIDQAIDLHNRREHELICVEIT